VLERELGARGRWPAIDILHSVSRVMPSVATAAHVAAARRARELLGTYERNRDLITLGAYKPGADPAVDEAIARIDAIETEHVAALAQQLFAAPPVLAAVGPLANLEPYDTLAARLAA